jgi:hypothetical protein
MSISEPDEAPGIADEGYAKPVKVVRPSGPVDTARAYPNAPDEADGESHAKLAKAQTEEALRRRLGDGLNFDVAATSKALNRSPAFVYRTMADGRLEYIFMGDRRAVTREILTRALTEGIPPRNKKARLKRHDRRG